ncbi:hypothetical protein ACXR0O_05390 [Verrucomicrobiota bacterium sgz303538]
MNRLCLAICASVAGAMLHLPAASAAAPTDYQVTGPVLELTDTVITVQKGKERWQIARDPSTKVTGDLKVGAKVTVHYTMTAKAIEVKPEAGAEPKKP